MVLADTTLAKALPLSDHCRACSYECPLCGPGWHRGEPVVSRRQVALNYLGSVTHGFVLDLVRSSSYVGLPSHPWGSRSDLSNC